MMRLQDYTLIKSYTVHLDQTSVSFLAHLCMTYLCMSIKYLMIISNMSSVTFE